MIQGCRPTSVVIQPASTAMKPEALLQASTFIQAIEERQDLKVACLEEVAYKMGYISADDVRRIAKPMEKMTCWVPDTQRVPDGFRTRRTAVSQRDWNAWSSATPRDSSQRPLLTEARLPLWQVVPPFESMYGGSANATSTEWGGSFSSAATQSPWTSAHARPRSAVPGNPSQE